MCVIFPLPPTNTQTHNAKIHTHNIVLISYQLVCREKNPNRGLGCCSGRDDDEVSVTNSEVDEFIVL